MANRKGPWQEYGSDIARTRRAPAPATPTGPPESPTRVAPAPAHPRSQAGQGDSPWGPHTTAVPNAPPPGSSPPPPNARPQAVPPPGTSLPGRELGAGGVTPAGQRTSLRLPSALGPGWAAGWGLAESERSGWRDRTATIDERGPVRRTFDDIAWRYRSAPLWLRVTADVAAALVVLGLIVGAVLAVRPDGRTEQAAAVGPTTTTTAPPP